MSELDDRPGLRMGEIVTKPAPDITGEIHTTEAEQALQLLGIEPITVAIERMRKARESIIAPGLGRVITQ